MNLTSTLIQFAIDDGPTAAFSLAEEWYATLEAMAEATHDEGELWAIGILVEQVGEYITPPSSNTEPTIEDRRRDAAMARMDREGGDDPSDYYPVSRSTYRGD